MASLAQVLDSGSFVQFWSAASQCRDLLNSVVGFDDAVRECTASKHLHPSFSLGVWRLIDRSCVCCSHCASAQVHIPAHCQAVLGCGVGSLGRRAERLHCQERVADRRRHRVVPALEGQPSQAQGTEEQHQVHSYVVDISSQLLLQYLIAIILVRVYACRAEPISVECVVVRCMCVCVPSTKAIDRHRSSIYSFMSE